MPTPDVPRYRTTFLRLLRFLTPYKVSLWLSIVLAFAAQAGTLAFPWLTGDVVGAIMHKHRGELPWLLGIVLAVGVVKAA